MNMDIDRINSAISAYIEEEVIAGASLLIRKERVRKRSEL